MKVNEIKLGEFFCIGGTKSYPKLRLNVGYIDVRDEIVQRDEQHIMSFDCKIMSEEAVAEEFKKYDMTLNDVKEIKKTLLMDHN